MYCSFIKFSLLLMYGFVVEWYIDSYLTASYLTVVIEYAISIHTNKTYATHTNKFYVQSKLYTNNCVYRQLYIQTTVYIDNCTMYIQITVHTDNCIYRQLYSVHTDNCTYRQLYIQTTPCICITKRQMSLFIQEISVVVYLSIFVYSCLFT